MTNELGRQDVVCVSLQSEVAVERDSEISNLRDTVSRRKTRIQVYDFGLFRIASEAILSVPMYNIIDVCFLLSSSIVWCLT